MIVTFVLPKVSRYPVGGYKMVFEYANRLCNKGHDINIIYINDDFMSKYKLPRFVRKKLAIHYTALEPRWFELDTKISKISCFNNDMSRKIIEVSDVVIATAVQTVDLVDRLFQCKKIYFIQGYEDWGIGEDELVNTYKNNMTKIAVANWLKNIVDEYSSSTCKVIKNPIDSSIYKIKVDYYDRPKFSVAVLYNELPVKGFKYAYAALLQLKKCIPELTVQMFGRNKYPYELPEWINYTENATQDQTVDIYNSSRVFVCASVEEGYGLTGLEAMACGCTLVSTRFKGVLEYANDKSAVLVPIKDVDGLVEAIKQVFTDEKSYDSMRDNALEKVKQFSWSLAVKEFEDLLLENQEG